MRYRFGQNRLEMHKLSFCICPRKFVKSQWLSEPLKVKVVLALYYGDRIEWRWRYKSNSFQMGRASCEKNRSHLAGSILRVIPLWLNGERLPNRTETTLRRITTMGDEILYGVQWWGGRHRKVRLGDLILSSSLFQDHLGIVLRHPTGNKLAHELSAIHWAFSKLTASDPHKSFRQILPEPPPWFQPLISDQEYSELYEDL
jgi:hypothetical protein